MRIEDQRDPEFLRQAAMLLEKENERLAKRVAALVAEVSTLRGEDPAKLQLRLTHLEQQLSSARNKLFASSSSERRGDETKDSPADKPAQKGHGRREQPELPIEPVVHELDEADRVCTSCGGALREWPGQEEESFEIDVEPRRFVMKRHLRKKYRCKCGGCIEVAPAPLKLFDGARYSIAFAISVVVAKYLEHLPLERQVRAMQREGLTTDAQTLGIRPSDSRGSSSPRTYV